MGLRKVTTDVYECDCCGVELADEAAMAGAMMAATPVQAELYASRGNYHKFLDEDELVVQPAFVKLLCLDCGIAISSVFNQRRRT